MAKQHILSISEDTYDFVLIGLSILKDQYETAVALNEVIKINLELQNHFSLALKDRRVFKFSLFSFQDPEFRLEYLFLPNASNFEEPNLQTGSQQGLFSDVGVEERSLLVKELPKTDYFLILRGEDAELYKHQVIRSIKNMSDLISVQLIDISDLPSRSNLVF